MMCQHLRLLASAVLPAAALLFSVASAQAQVKSPTLDAIKQRGELLCGVDTGIPGFAFQDIGGKWKGFDIAYCRAIAAAVLGDPEKVRYVGTHRQGALHRAAVGRDRRVDPRQHADLHARHAARPDRDGRNLVRRPGVHGRKKSLGVALTKELDGATICMITGATLELNIADYGTATRRQDQLAAVRQAGGGVRRRRVRAMRRLHRRLPAAWQRPARP